MASPYPDLQVWPTSGTLRVPWADMTNTLSESIGHLGDDGVACGMKIWVFWRDLVPACSQILGYSYRQLVTNSVLGAVIPQLRRVIPWQHPLFNQLYAKAITDIRGVRSLGNSVENPVDLQNFVGRQGGGAGAGFPINAGPFSQFEFAELTISFWRPPYYIRTDQDIVNGIGVQQEWLRYVDKHWDASTQVLSREGANLRWAGGMLPSVPPNPNPLIPGSTSIPVTHNKVSRRWYRLPEAAIYSPISDGTPQGFPYALYYCQTPSFNPITGYPRVPVINGVTYPFPIVNCLNLPIGSGAYSLQGDFVQGTGVINNVVSGGLAGTPFVGDSITGPVDGPIGSGTGAYILQVTPGPPVSILMSTPSNRTGTFTVVMVTDAFLFSQFFGCPMGTLRYDRYEILPAPLHLPPWVMQIPLFAANEPISQLQYDVVFHFDLFDPERRQASKTIAPLLTQLTPVQPHRGHNLGPSAVDRLWYPITSNNTASSAFDDKQYFLTQFHYACFEDLFTII